MSLKAVLQEKREDVLKIAAKHGAFNVRVFGSVAREEETDKSDIDLLIDYDLSKISPWFPVGLIEELEQLLQRRVDIVTTQSLHYFLRDKILQEAIKL